MPPLLNDTTVVGTVRVFVAGSDQANSLSLHEVLDFMALDGRRA